MSQPTIEDACRVLHDAYESAAARHGWETQARSRVAWDDVPEENRATMRDAVTALLDFLGVASSQIEAETSGAAALWQLYFALYYGGSETLLALPPSVQRAYMAVQRIHHPPRRVAATPV
jgi:hypothetical protein